MFILGDVYLDYDLPKKHLIIFLFYQLMFDEFILQKWSLNICYQLHEHKTWQRIIKLHCLHMYDCGGMQQNELLDQDHQSL